MRALLRSGRLLCLKPQWGAGAVIAVALALSGGIQATSADAANKNGTTTTTRAAGSTLNSWKHNYESAVGVILGDIYIVANTGVKDAKHPTEKSVGDALLHCRKWRDNAMEIPKRVPMIPSASAQQTWGDLIHVSRVAATDCVTAIKRDSKTAASGFDPNMVEAETLGHRLIRQLQSAKG